MSSLLVFLAVWMMCAVPAFADEVDIDECITGAHNCTTNQYCVDTEGSFYCEDFGFAFTTMFPGAPPGFSNAQEPFNFADCQAAEYGQGVLQPTLMRNQQYPNNADECWAVINNEPDMDIVISFTYFDLEQGYDYLRIYADDIGNSELTGRYATILPADVIVSAPVVYIRFTSDYSVTRYTGFQIRYSLGDYVLSESELEEDAIIYDSQGCVVRTAESGTISPNSIITNGDYENNDDSCWVIQNDQPGTFIHLSFLVFNLERNYDYLRVRDYSTVNSQLTGQRLGNNMWSDIWTAENQLNLRFTSDYSVTRPIGFRVQYTIEDELPEFFEATTASYNFDFDFADNGTNEFFDYPMGTSPVYGSNTTVALPECSLITSESGTIERPTSGSGVYMNNANDCWELRNEQPGSTIQISFIRFNLEANYDYLSIEDGNTVDVRLTGQMMGTNIPADILSSESSVVVHFTSDYSVTRSGFRIQYTIA